MNDDGMYAKEEEAMAAHLDEFRHRRDETEFQIWREQWHLVAEVKRVHPKDDDEQPGVVMLRGAWTNCGCRESAAWPPSAADASLSGRSASDGKRVVMWGKKSALLAAAVEMKWALQGCPSPYLVAPRPGLEPGTYGLTVRRSTN